MGVPSSAVPGSGLRVRKRAVRCNEELDFFAQRFYSPANPSVTKWQARNERGASSVSTFTAGPGGRVLWCLRRKRSDVRCVLFAGTSPIEIHVLQDTDVVLRETFFEEPAALSWAWAYAARLRNQGWRDSPEDCSPSSAA